MNNRITRALAVGLLAVTVLGAACQETGATEQEATPAPTGAAQQSDGAGSVSFREPVSAVDVVQRIGPSVVHIQARGLRLGNEEIPASGVGTGVIWDREGHIITNNHVVTLDSGQPAQEFIVDLTDGRTLEATLVGRDEYTDLAVIKIDADNLTPAAFGDSDATQVGEPVVAIGHALDLEGGPTVTTGVISARNRSLEGSTLVGLLQTDAAINHGNSGGPLANLRGELIGINTAAIFSGGTDPVQGIGFAVPSNTVREIVTQIIEDGRVRRGTLGITVRDLTPALARNLGVDAEHGILVMEVLPGTPAANAGLRSGDIITRIAGKEVRNLGELADILLDHPPGETAEVEYLRGGRTERVEVTLTEPQS